jgi:UDP-glucose 4-epimerase
MNILIIGASGFIGANLVEYLSPRHEVLAPAHAELELLDEDAVKKYFDIHSVDIVIHSAVRPGHRNAKDPSHQLYHNTRMFFNIVRNSDRFKKMIFLGSGLTYDMRYYQPRMKEEYFDTHVPVDEGGFSKYIISKYIEKVENIIELRVFGIFGKYEDYAIRFISNAICKTLFDLPITIKQNRKFDYIYIDDLMPIIDHFLENKGEYRCYNATPDESVELKTIAESVKKISGKNIPIIISQEGSGPEYSGDNTRLRKEIKHLSFMNMDKAINDLFNWYSENRASINREVLLYDK